MRNKTYLLGSVALLLAVSACGNNSKTNTKDPNEEPQSTLGDFRSQLLSRETPDVVTPGVDPAAANINPLKTPENYLEREVFEEILVKAREIDGYLDRSMKVTKESLPSLPYKVSFEDYAAALENAAYIHASSLNGDRPAHIALKQARALIAPVLVMGTRKDLDIPVSAFDFKRMTTDFRKRTYLNYFLTLDKIRAEESREDVAAKAEAIAEMVVIPEED